ncbi:MAG: murein biosynthesis integral membrane protein MurJ [Gammaproteobacteria bacterium]|nr:murein biosynthesis integral membrane protein MurJ [Gammaproteobacteria bacterium]
MSGRLLKSTVTVGGMTLISRVLGLVRDIVIARVIGAGVGADAFFVAFKIPNFMRRLFAEGAFSQAFVPVLSDYRATRDPETVRELIGAVSGMLGGILLLVTLVGVLAAPLLVSIFAPGFLDEPVKFAMAADMVRITFPYLMFISLTALVAGVLNSYGHFAVPAFTPVLLNLCLIGATLWFAPGLDRPVMALAWAVLLAGILQLGFQLVPLARMGFLVRPHWRRDDPGVMRIKKLMLPAIFGSSVAQVNLLVDTLIASFLVTGSVSWLYFSDRLMEFPLGVFGIALATVILPSLSRDHASASHERYTATLDWALRLVILITVPAAMGLCLLAGPMLTALFQYGAFSAHDMAMSRLSLMAYALGLPGFVLVKVLSSGFFARQDTRTPVRVGIIAMTSNMVMNVLFVVPLVYLDFAGPHAGLALATSISAYLNAGLLYRGLYRETGFRPGAGWFGWLLKVGAGVAAMSALLMLGPDSTDAWLVMGWSTRTLHLAGWIAAAVSVFVVVMFALGVRPAHLISAPGSDKHSS